MRCKARRVSYHRGQCEQSAKESGYCGTHENALRRQEEKRGGTHPWAKFLSARAEAIDWMHRDDLSDEEIARTLSMDTEQVMLIRTRSRSHG